MDQAEKEYMQQLALYQQQQVAQQHEWEVFYANKNAYEENQALYAGIPEEYRYGYQGPPKVRKAEAEEAENSMSLLLDRLDTVTAILDGDGNSSNNLQNKAEQKQKQNPPAAGLAAPPVEAPTGSIAERAAAATLRREAERKVLELKRRNASGSTYVGSTKGSSNSSNAPSSGRNYSQRGENGTCAKPTAIIKERPRDRSRSRERTGSSPSSSKRRRRSRSWRRSRSRSDSRDRSQRRNSDRNRGGRSRSQSCGRDKNQRRRSRSRSGRRRRSRSKGRERRSRNRRRSRSS